jgi:hypothetical protein
MVIRNWLFIASAVACRRILELHLVPEPRLFENRGTYVRTLLKFIANRMLG